MTSETALGLSCPFGVQDHLLRTVSARTAWSILPEAAT